MKKHGIHAPENRKKENKVKVEVKVKENISDPEVFLSSTSAPTFSKNLFGSGANVLGFTLVELMMAVAILAIALILTLSLVQEGISKMADMRVKSQVKECARLTMEYLISLPPDVIYRLSPGSPITGNFYTGTGGDENLKTFADQSELRALPPDLPDFINDYYPICRELSNTAASSLGSKIRLQYTICPGCTAYQNSAYPGFIQCAYFVKLRLTYNSIRDKAPGDTAGVKHIDYNMRMFTGQQVECDAPTACNPNPPPNVEYLDNCDFP